jgi:hypothetical protein
MSSADTFIEKGNEPAFFEVSNLNGLGRGHMAGPLALTAMEDFLAGVVVLGSAGLDVSAGLPSMVSPTVAFVPCHEGRGTHEGGNLTMPELFACVLFQTPRPRDFELGQW